MTKRLNWLAMLLTAGILTAAPTAAIGTASAQAAECSVCEFSDEEGEVFP